MKETNTAALLEAEILGHAISTHALVIETIGNDEDGTPIEILFGALAMQVAGSMAGDHLAVCVACGTIEGCGTQEGWGRRRPARGRRFFCKECGKRGVPVYYAQHYPANLWSRKRKGD